jgi:hypothetical protein
LGGAAIRNAHAAASTAALGRNSRQNSGIAVRPERCGADRRVRATVVIWATIVG